jgi:signal transduction histidine kinase
MLDPLASLQEVARLAVGSLADWCIVDVVIGDGDNRPRRVAAARQGDDVPELTEAARRLGPDDELPPMLESVSAPLRARGQTFGRVVLGAVTLSHRLGPIGQELTHELAVRAALALDNARLYREAQEHAQHQSVLNAALRETVDERDRVLVDLRQALRTRDEFLASASHDLKNPLASIKATAQLLQRRLARSEVADAARLAEGLQRLDAIATRAARQVEELLDLARMQMGRPLDLEPVPTDIVALAREVVAEQQPSSERHVLAVEADRPALVGNWDGPRLTRALTNLVDNALKYSPDGGRITVAVRAETDEAGRPWACVEVRDPGIGVPPDELDRIFERFHRASNVEGRIGGTGIGLASARHILESHGGRISVSSEPGVGTTFTLHLPLEPPVPAEGASR